MLWISNKFDLKRKLKGQYYILVDVGFNCWNSAVLFWTISNDGVVVVFDSLKNIKAPVKSFYKRTNLNLEDNLYVYIFDPKVFKIEYTIYNPNKKCDVITWNLYRNSGILLKHSPVAILTIEDIINDNRSNYSDYL